MRRRSSRLSEVDMRLWAEVARSVRPLAGREAPELPPAAPPAPQTPVAAPATKGAKPRPDPLKPPPLAPLDRRLRKALKRGTHAIDGVIDLHGLRQDEAHARLIAFLHRSRARGASLVLVVTGKGSGVSSEGAERGVLRRVVPLWLRLPEWRMLVVGVDEAGRGHGGEGALYVRLRRQRPGGREEP